MTFFILLSRSAGAWLVPPDLGGANWRCGGACGWHELRYALLEALEPRRFEEAPESMSSHDFKGLHDKEFEALGADLLGVSMSVRFERFKPGPDHGVDARCFEAGGGGIILQCKHRPASSIIDLARHLRDEE
jgi:hypothetical protein